MSFKVLVVDDHEVARLGISQMLRDAGFEVSGAVGGRDVPSLLADRGCDVVLLENIRLDARESSKVPEERQALAASQGHLAAALLAL